MAGEIKIRILFLIGSYGNGGKERQLAELIKGLPDDRYEIHLLVKSSNAHYLEEFKDKLVSFSSLRREKFGRKAIFDLKNHIQKTQPDIVHSWADTTSFYAALIRLIFRFKYHLIDGSIRMAPSKKERFTLSHLQRMVINSLADIIVANSRAGLQIFNVPPSKSRCINNGFNMDRLRNLKDANELRKEFDIRSKFIIGMVARFDHEKDWNTFFLAAEQLLNTRKDVTFIMVGGGKDLDVYKRRVKSEDHDHFVFTGERDDVESIISIIDICVLSSYTEGISNSILEYMALGKPVTASGTGGLPELVIHPETGFIYNVGDFKELVHYWNVLLDDAPLRDRMGKSGKKRVAESFSFDKMITEFDRLYQQVLCVE